MGIFDFLFRKKPATPSSKPSGPAVAPHSKDRAVVDWLNNIEHGSGPAVASHSEDRGTAAAESDPTPRSKPSAKESRPSIDLAVQSLKDGKLEGGPEPRTTETSQKPPRSIQATTRSFTVAGETWTSNLGMTFAYIPEGKFLMGGPVGEFGRGEDEVEHRVIISRPFLIGVHPVTQAQWEKIMGGNPSYYKGDNNPVEDVRCREVKEFCAKLSEMEGFRYRLPTEAEWEYACRAGATIAFGGTGVLEDMAWYKGNCEGTTHPVGQKVPNSWGLYDMHGNVWEWCDDDYARYEQGELRDPRGRGQMKVLRGGSFAHESAFCRAACRAKAPFDFRRDDFGFRLYREL